MRSESFSRAVPSPVMKRKDTSRNKFNRQRHPCGRHNNHLQTQPIKLLPNDNQVSAKLTDANVSDILTHLTAYDAESISQREHRGDRFQGVSLQPIVHVNVRLSTRLVTLSFHDHPSARFACFFVHFLRSVVRLECFYSVFVFPSGLQEESRRDQFRVRATAGQSDLLAHRRHRVP